MQRINRPAQPVRVSRVLKNLLALIFIVLLASSGGLSTLGFAKPAASVGPAALFLDRDGADRVPSSPDTWDHGPGTSMRVCGKGPQARRAAIATKFFDSFNARDFSAWRAVLAEDFEAIYAPTGPAPLDAETAQMVNESFLIPYPDLHFDVDRVLVATTCDFVAVYWTATGTNTGPTLLPSGTIVEPSGVQVIVPGVYTVEIQDGQILREWTHWNQLLPAIETGTVIPL